jgi:hypothetical protein
MELRTVVGAVVSFELVANTTSVTHKAFGNLK